MTKLALVQLSAKSLAYQGCLPSALLSTLTLACACSSAPRPPVSARPPLTSPADHSPAPPAAVSPLPAKEYADYRAAPEPGAWCKTRVGYPQHAPFERCVVSLLGNGSLLLILIVPECGADSCDVQGWALGGTSEALRVRGIDLGGSVEASADGSFLISDSATALVIPGSDPAETDPFGGKRQLVSERHDLNTGTTEPFAPCFSLRLSPDGSWFACRDEQGNVLGVSKEGGVPVVLACASAAPAFQVYSYNYPGQVEFVGTTRLRFELESEQTGEVQAQTIEVPERPLSTPARRCPDTPPRRSK